MKYFVLAAILGLAAATPFPQAAPAECSEAFTDSIIFEATMDEFLAAKAAGEPASCNFEDNGCSSSPDDPFGFAFLESCQRHDFGYRNFKEQNRFSEENRERIDDQFLEDMNAQCEVEENVTACRATARVYHFAVRTFGSKKVRRDGQVISLELPEHL